jgi:hypothetical protein
MKKILFFAVLLFGIVGADAQDKIISKSGKVVKCIFISSDSVNYYYKKLDTSDAKIYSVAKSTVSKVHMGTFDSGGVSGNSDGSGSDSIAFLRNGEPLQEDDQSSVAFAFGVLHGGGSLFGGDLEFRLGRFTAIQFGVGFKGYGAALNFHLAPSLRSSYLSLMYWHQGIGSSFSQSMVGPTVVVRAWGFFTFSLGLGYILDQNPNFIVEKKKGDVIHTYAVGGYATF